jgi:hypothetical protein
MENEPNEVSHFTTAILRSIKFTKNPLFPISSHISEIIFDVKKIREYLAQDGIIVKENFGTSREISGESFEETVTNLNSSSNAEGSGTYGLAAFSGSVSAEFNMQSSNKQQMKFSQIRKIAQYAKLSLHKPLLREKNSGDEGFLNEAINEYYEN